MSVFSEYVKREYYLFSLAIVVCVCVCMYVLSLIDFCLVIFMFLSELNGFHENQPNVMF